MEQREYFGYTQTLSLALDTLPEDKLKTFLKGVEGFGFARVEPDFNDKQLQDAWAKVRPNMAKGWKLAVSGAKGGKARAKVEGCTPESANKQPTTTKPTPPREKPTHQEPSEEMCAYLRRHGFTRIVGSFCGKEMEYLVNVFGWCATSIALWEVEKNGDATGAQVFQVACKRLEDAERAFISWHDANFKKLAKMVRKVTLNEWCELRLSYGRCNIVIKLQQINKNRNYNTNADENNSLKNYLHRSCNYQGKFHLDYNDNPTDEKINQPSGFDKDFDLCAHGLHIIRSWQ